MKSSNTAEGGFLRMPNSWLLLEVSPGAKVLLAHFCSVANENGSSYYSYEQLTKIVGRKKSSICSYVKELRDIGVIKTREQKMANGYNYRLLITISEWKKLVTNWAQKTAATAKKSIQKNECSVQQDERKDPSGPINNTHQNKTPSRFAKSAIAKISGRAPAATPVVWSSEDEREWSEFCHSDRDPISVFEKIPSQRLTDKLQMRLDYLKGTTGTIAPAAREITTQGMLEAFCYENKITATDEAMKKFVKILIENTVDQLQVNAFFEKMSAEWQPSWKRLSNDYQIKLMIKDLNYVQSPIIKKSLAEIGKINSRLARVTHAKKLTAKRNYEAA